ncbi:hypothetical protein AB0H20_21690 [Nocardia fluminea]|uniref:hypothetical protein n=1 Tax=Nocardia fluminea TaxID=134984 RepID=UPI0033C2FB5C
MACRTTAVKDKYRDRRAIARECELIVHFLDFLRVQLGQWAARTPDDYSDEARMLAGQRALGFLDNALTQLAPIRDALAADVVAARRIGDPA